MCKNKIHANLKALVITKSKVISKFDIYNFLLMVYKKGQLNFIFSEKKSN